MFAELIPPEDPRWTRVLARVPHDVYHLPEYSRFAGQHEGGHPLAFYAECREKEMLIPLLVRPLPRDLAAPAGWKDVSSPYGYPGPLTSHPDDDQWLRECRTALGGLARTHDIVSAFLRLHPLRGVSAEKLSAYGALIEHGPIVYIDLTKAPDELYADTRPSHRRGIRRLRRAGFVATIDDWSVYSVFPSLYRATMDRVSADPFYYFSDRYFTDLALMLKEHLHVCAVHTQDGHLAAAGLFIETNGVIQYHLGGTASAYLKGAPSKLMFDAAAAWGRSIGGTVLNLGGGTGSRCDSLFQFKAGFSGSRALFHTIRIVFDHERYSELARIWRERRGSEGSGTGYFPIYRQPSSETCADTRACTTQESNV